MSYKKWYIDHYPFLYEIYYHIILPERKKLTPTQASILTFSEFCQLSYSTHGARAV